MTIKTTHRLRVRLILLGLLGAIGFNLSQPSAAVAQKNPAPEKQPVEADEADEGLRDELWHRYSGIQIDLRFGRISREDAIASYEKLVQEGAGDVGLTPFLRYTQASLNLQLEKAKEAKRILLDLQKNYPDHYLNTRRMAALKDVETGKGTNSVARALQVVEQHIEFRKSRPKPWSEPEPAPEPRVILDTSYGPITLVFYPSEAPKLVENFLKLVKEGYYDGMWFHRIDVGLRVLLGDPNTKEGGDENAIGGSGPGYEIDRELNVISHVRGTLSAKQVDRTKNNHGSQFFINTGYPTYLDVDWTVFGRVESGMDVADKIAALEIDGNWHPLEKVTIRSARIVE